MLAAVPAGKEDNLVAAVRGESRREVVIGMHREISFFTTSVEALHIDVIPAGAIVLIHDGAPVLRIARKETLSSTVGDLLRVSLPFEVDAIDVHAMVIKLHVGESTAAGQNGKPVE